MTIEIRRAMEADLPAIGRVVVDAWRSTFAGILSVDFLNDMSSADQTERHRRSFARAGVTYRVASDESGAVIGFASGGPSRQADFPHGNEVYAIYILESYRGQKIGVTLFRRIVGDLNKSGRKGLILLALAQNPNRGFYERLGGRQVGAKSLKLGAAMVEQFAYLWDDIVALSRHC